MQRYFRLVQQSIMIVQALTLSLQWHHNERDDVSNHRRLDCSLNRLFRRRAKKASSSASLAFVRGIHRSPLDSPHKGPVTRKIFPFDDVIILGADLIWNIYISISIIFRSWIGTISWKASSWNTRACLFCSQYHGFWWHGDERSHGISSHGTDYIFPQYSGLSASNVNPFTTEGNRLKWQCILNISNVPVRSQTLITVTH